MTQQTPVAPGLFPAPSTSERTARRAGISKARRREGRGQVVTTALLVLLLLAGDLLFALQLPVQESTCSDRLCGPALPVAGGAVVLGVLGAVSWQAWDRLRDRGWGTWGYWLALVPAAAPWALLALRLQWW